MINQLDNALYFQQQTMDLLNQRQEILAANIANADTPGYQARDIDFSQQLKQIMALHQTMPTNLSLNETSPLHIASSGNGFSNLQLKYRIPTQPSADDNTVDMNLERVNFTNNSLMYEAGLSITNNQIKNIMSVLA